LFRVFVLPGWRNGGRETVKPAWIEFLGHPAQSIPELLLLSTLSSSSNKPYLDPRAVAWTLHRVFAAMSKTSRCRPDPT
jgi:hypothetical protein